ncbi:hypothetical protein BSLA_03r0962 [Burkholderia stabilis]|nr:hypothetical protein BSLA_03r0962 [Burkholderia stabilis]
MTKSASFVEPICTEIIATWRKSEQMTVWNRVADERLDVRVK